MRYTLRLKPDKSLDEMTDYKLVKWIEVCHHWFETVQITLDGEEPDLINIALVGEQLSYGSAELIKRWKHRQEFS